MIESIKVKNTDLILKYVNCLERVFFIDNKWMKHYKDLKNGIIKEYEGVPLYLKTLINYFKKNNLNIFEESLPEIDEIAKVKDKIDCIILESEGKASFISDEEEKQYVVVACPKIEKIFHFKITGSLTAEYSPLAKASINNFYYHPALPRIKIYSRNFSISTNKAKLSDLQFMYTNPSDALMKATCLKIVNNKIIWDELIPDPYYGVQIGNLAHYFVCPIKIKKLKRNIENLRQLTLVCEDFEGKEYSFSITTTLYRKIYNETPEEKELATPRFLRCLVFQGFGEDFRHILDAEEISNEDFEKDSFLAFVKFRRFVEKTKVSVIPKKLPESIQQEGDLFFYLPPPYKSEMFQVAEDLKSKKTISDYGLLRNYHDFVSQSHFHVGLLEDYQNKKSNAIYKKVDIININPFGIHREILKDPLTKMTFFSMNNQKIIFCTACKQYLKKVKTKDIPLSCPLCRCNALVGLDSIEDKELFDLIKTPPSLVKKFDLYNRMSTLFYPFRKYLYYVLNAMPGYSLNTDVNILNEFKSKYWLDNEEIFFEKLFKLKEAYNRSLGVHDVLYRLEKNEA